MIKDKCGLVHLTQDQKHLVVDKLFVLFEVTAHMLLQLVTDLRMRIEHATLYTPKTTAIHREALKHTGSLLQNKALLSGFMYYTKFHSVFQQ